MTDNKKTLNSFLKEMDSLPVDIETKLSLYARKDGIVYEIKDMSYSLVHDHGSVILEIGGEVK